MSRFVSLFVKRANLWRTIVHNRNKPLYDSMSRHGAETLLYRMTREQAAKIIAGNY